MRTTRRQWLGALTAGSGVALLPRTLTGQSDENPPNVLTGVRLEPFVDRLTIPTIMRPDERRSSEKKYTIRLTESRQQFHRDLPPAVVWGFEGSTPGPTIVAKRGVPIAIDWMNQLPAKHRLTVDHTLDGAGKDIPEVRTAIHLHGGHVSPENDGYPENWIVPGQKQTTIYPNQQPGATLWYHDHAMGITRLNAMMGLAGFYVVHDPEEDSLGLPSGNFDIPLAIQDRILDAHGQLAYPVSENPDSPWVPEFFGTSIVVNGKVTPYFEVEPRQYRFRLLNACNARVLQLSLSPEQHFIQIASDGGLLPTPATLPELMVAPGERIEAIIDFRGREGRRITMVNHAPAPYPSGGNTVPGLVMQFRVKNPLHRNVDDARIPEVLVEVPRLQPSTAVKTRRLLLVETMPTEGQPHRVLLDGKRFMDPVSENPACGSTEIWELMNTTIDAHPIHLHALHFQLLDRTGFDVRRYQRAAEVVQPGKTILAAAGEAGWKDTILCPPGQITRIIAKFPNQPGRYVWHCHTLEHEDNEMMRPYEIKS